MNRTVLNTIACMVAGLNDSVDADHADDIMDELRQFVCMTAPSGSGFNNGTQLLTAKPLRLEFGTAFHHMHENGYYDGWTQYKVIVTPSFNGFDLKVTGRDRNGIKDYIADVFYNWLATPMDSPAMDSTYRGKYFHHVTRNWRDL